MWCPGSPLKREFPGERSNRFCQMPLISQIREDRELFIRFTDE